MRRTPADPGTTVAPAGFSRVEPPIDRMRARAHQLRRMAGIAHDPRMIEMLLKMAGEIEEDVARLESGKAPAGSPQ